MLVRLKERVLQSKNLPMKKQPTKLLKTVMHYIGTWQSHWRYELGERRKTLECSRSMQPIQVQVPRIDRSLLHDPIEFGDHPSDRDLFVGRGSFGVVKCQIYRGIRVAVKEFLPHTVQDSVMKEAHVQLGLCHPYLPLLLGVCISELPYIHVVQYYGIGFKSITFHRELC